MKRLAAAMLLAVINVMSSASVADASNEVDDDGDADADVTPDSVSEFRKPSRGLERLDALSLTSHACHEALDAAWVLRHHGKLSGSAAVTVREHAPYTAVLTLVVNYECPMWPSVLARALFFCRDEEHALKIVIEHDGAVTDAVLQNAAESCGFQPVRTRLKDGVHLVECYVDLYARTPAAGYHQSPTLPSL